MKSFALFFFLFVASAYIFGVRAEEETAALEDDSRFEDAPVEADEEQTEEEYEEDEDEAENDELNEDETEDDEENEDEEDKTSEVAENENDPSWLWRGRRRRRRSCSARILSGCDSGYKNGTKFCLKCNCKRSCKKNWCNRKKKCWNFKCGTKKECSKVLKYKVVRFYSRQSSYGSKGYYAGWRSKKVPYTVTECKDVDKNCTKCRPAYKYVCGENCSNSCKRTKCYVIEKDNSKNGDDDDDDKNGDGKNGGDKNGYSRRKSGKW